MMMNTKLLPTPSPSLGLASPSQTQLSQFLVFPIHIWAEKLKPLIHAHCRPSVITLITWAADYQRASDHQKSAMIYDKAIHYLNRIKGLLNAENAQFYPTLYAELKSQTPSNLDTLYLSHFIYRATGLLTPQSERTTRFLHDTPKATENQLLDPQQFLIYSYENKIFIDEDSPGYISLPVEESFLNEEEIMILWALHLHNYSAPTDFLTVHKTRVSPEEDIRHDLLHALASSDNVGIFKEVSPERRRQIIDRIIPESFLDIQRRPHLDQVSLLKMMFLLYHELRTPFPENPQWEKSHELACKQVKRLLLNGNLAIYELKHLWPLPDDDKNQRIQLLKDQTQGETQLLDSGGIDMTPVIIELYKLSIPQVLFRLKLSNQFFETTAHSFVQLADLLERNDRALDTPPTALESTIAK